MNFINYILRTEGCPAIPIMTHPGIEAIGKTVKDAVTDGKIHYEAVKYLADLYDSAACTTIMDLTVEAEAFGARVMIPEDEIPSVTGAIVHDEASVNALEIPDMTKGRIPQYLLANRLAAENIQKPVLSGCIGPYSLAGRLYDMTEIMIAIYIDPETIVKLLDKCTRFLIQYCRELKNTGTAGVIIAEPAAGLLSNDDCMTYSTYFVKQIVEAVQDDDFAVILHNCGNTGHATQAMIESKACGLHFGNKINMTDVLKECPSDVVVMGNLDPVGIFKQGTGQEVRIATKKMLADTRGYDNFVISSGCDLPPHVSQENLLAFFEEVKIFNEQNR